jgi:hypothetical protein
MNVPVLSSTFTSVVIGAEKMQRYIRLVANDPTVVAWGHVKDVAGLHFDDASVIHRSDGTPRYHHSNMLTWHEVAPRGAPTSTDQKRAGCGDVISCG